MTFALSPNAKAILLLTAPLIAGQGTLSTELLSPGEYKRIARHLRELKRQPADFLSRDSADLLRACRLVVEDSRLQRLLGRGLLLSQAIERWQARAIWVVSRADADYPSRMKARLKEDAPPVLYGCGDINLLETGGLAVVGSRNVDDSLIEYTMVVGRLTALARRTLISGGARGIDQAAMRGAMEAGGKVIGVLADSLEKSALNREHRNLLLDGQLILVSPCDPSSGFNVGNAMQRNKLIYALADAALVVNSDRNKGGTWAGATEQLDKLRYVPVYVRSTGEHSAGLDALRNKGAIPWPNPHNVEAFKAVFDVPLQNSAAVKTSGFPLFPNDKSSNPGSAPKVTHISVSPPEVADAPSPEITASVKNKPSISIHNVEEQTSTKHEQVPRPVASETMSQAESSPADTLFALVREVILRLLITPMKDAEVATALDVSNAQAKAWLQRLVEEGVLEKKKKPSSYIVKQSRLFG